MDYEIIGAQIRQNRLQRKWTQAYLAEKAGIEPSNLSHIERAATKVSLPTLIAIANALDVTLDELVYSNLVRSSHVSSRLIDELLEDCSPQEMVALATILKAAKEGLRAMKK